MGTLIKAGLLGHQDSKHSDGGGGHSQASQREAAGGKRFGLAVRGPAVRGEEVRGLERTLSVKRF